MLPVSRLRFTFVPWKAEEEGALGRHMDVGLMPLVDDDFQRGKCGLKLLQYMAAGLPAVGSPVGVNAEIVSRGKRGFSRRREEDWGAALEGLVRSAELRGRWAGSGVAGAKSTTPSGAGCRSSSRSWTRVASGRPEPAGKVA